MKKSGKIRTSLWIDPTLLLLLNERGLTLSSFIGRVLPEFLDLPVDPKEKMIQESLSDAVLRTRSTYQQEMQKMIQEHNLESAVKDREKSKEIELIKLGECIQKSSAYPVFLRCLERKDFDDDTLSIVTMEVNRMNGNRYEMDQLWNLAIDWYRKYGATS